MGWALGGAWGLGRVGGDGGCASVHHAHNCVRQCQCVCAWCKQGAGGGGAAPAAGGRARVGFTGGPGELWPSTHTRPHTRTHPQSHTHPCHPTHPPRPLPAPPPARLSYAVCTAREHPLLEHVLVGAVGRRPERVVLPVARHEVGVEHGAVEAVVVWHGAQLVPEHHGGVAEAGPACANWGGVGGGVRQRQRQRSNRRHCAVLCRA